MNALYLLTLCFTFTLSFALLILGIGIIKEMVYVVFVERDILLGACLLVHAVLILGSSVLLAYFSFSLLRVI